MTRNRNRELNQQLRRSNEEKEELKQQLIELRAKMKTVAAICADAPEINFSNVKENHVRDLNDAMMNIWNLVSPFHNK